MSTLKMAHDERLREQVYELMAAGAPARVVVDTSLEPGAWYVVRALAPHEGKQTQTGAITDAAPLPGIRKVSLANAAPLSRLIDRGI